MKQIKKVLVLGSGALKIGEAGEFDYSGSQAIKALKEEGIKTVLVNPNIATIQTSDYLADTVYFLPINDFFVEKIIAKEKPDGILLSFGGQTALNCGVSLYKKGILKKYNVEILGSPITTIILAEDRQKFADRLRELNISIPQSKTANNQKEALQAAKQLGFPVMIRSGFALGGQGSGIAQNEQELKEITEVSFSFVSQVLVEKYLHHFKEVEYEVVRDKFDNCITVCNMENMDPLGIHTGESVVIAPSQTLTDYEYHTLRSISIKIARSLNVIGECNVQFALNPRPQSPEAKADGGQATPENGELEYYVIELNPRLSRSSALASKATGYPLAYVAAKLALGKGLTELENQVTKVTQSCFEPALDYVTVKIPRWDINKFKGAEESIGSSMKSVGEVMGIGRNFEEAYQKAIRMLDLDFEGGVDEKIFKNNKNSTKDLLIKPTPNRMFAIAKAFYENISVSEIYSLTGIDPWFLHRIKNIVDHEKELLKIKKLNRENLLELKILGFSDKRIGSLVNKMGLEIRTLRKNLRIVPSVFSIDTLAGEFPAKTNYLYMTYGGSHNDVEKFADDGVIVLGSGPYRIGSSVEFDWTCVNTVISVQENKKKAIVINCNPETVSTDYDISDRLYFEELTFERITDIYEFENPFGVIVSVGGQTPNNRAKALNEYGCKILGTDPKDIDKAEDRRTFSALLDSLSISQPAWSKFTKLSELFEFSEKVGFPVLIRPSYVLSGSNMKVCRSEDDLRNYLDVVEISKDHPVTVSKFIENAKEIEVDAVAEKGEIKTFVISEHVENAGVHSGDASIVFPPQKLYVETQRKLKKITIGLAKVLNITGSFNMQCLAKDNEVSVIEVNLRSSRTFPFISKVTGVNLITMATDAMFGKQVKAVNINALDYDFVASKVAQFSFARLFGADPVLDVEMASTGEVACFGQDAEEAFLLAELSVGGRIPKKGIFVSLSGDENKVKFLESARLLLHLKLPLYATEKTAAYLNKSGVKVQKLFKIHEKKSPNILNFFQKGKVDMAINITDNNLKKDVDDDYYIRRFAVDQNIPLFTNLQKAELFAKAIVEKDLNKIEIKSWAEFTKS